MSRRGQRKGKPINGILLLNKSIGVSSNHALQQAKHLFQAQKAGHTGSLDPLASGMLPICFGEATKISSFLLDSDKQYHTTAQLGVSTITGDAEGKIIQQTPVPNLSVEFINKALEQFRGPITQIPPMFSALKHQGKPLYELARQGIEIERKARKVVVYDLQLASFTSDTITLSVKCSKGTYIRTLVEDIGRALGCCAYVSQLHRDYVAPFDGRSANCKMHQLEQLEMMSEKERLSRLLPIDAALMAFPEIELDAEQCHRVLNGQAIPIRQEISGLVRLYSGEHDFLGIGSVEGNHQLKPKRIMQRQA